MRNIPTRKTVCLITPGHIASDPRLVKEAMALSANNFRVHIIFTQYVKYLIAQDNKILADNPKWTYQSLNWTGDSLLSKFNRLLGIINGHLSSNPLIKLNRNFFWQKRKAKHFKADLYIAHNLGALAISVIAAKVNHAKCEFDAEDFHRNEISDDGMDADVQLKIATEDAYIPYLNAMTTSSPQIAEQYISLYGRNVKVILNVFPKVNYSYITNDIKKPLQLFWFSQTIGPQRGLEIIIQAIGISGLAIELHLLGKILENYRYELTNLASVTAPLCIIHFHSPVHQSEIFELAAKLDIGIASEPRTPTNRDICLTNKLFTYILCGLAVVASNTRAQSAFFTQYGNAANLYEDANQLSKIFLKYHYERGLLIHEKRESYKLGIEKFNWEIEGNKFIAVVYGALLSS